MNRERQEKILAEIRQRVLEESENLKAEKERLLDEKVTLEAMVVKKLICDEKIDQSTLIRYFLSGIGGGMVSLPPRRNTHMPKLGLLFCQSKKIFKNGPGRDGIVKPGFFPVGKSR